MDLMTRRRALLARVESGGGLPDSYQQVAFLTSVIGAYINTGVVPNRNMRCVLKGITPSNISVPSFLFGCRKSSTEKRFWGITWQAYYKFGLGDKSNVSIYRAYENQDFVYDFNYSSNHNISVNSFVYPDTITISESETYSLPIWVFSTNNNGEYDSGQTQPFSVKEFAIYNSYADTSPSMQLIPCYRKADSKPGMYDLVSNTFFTNAGTGEFTVGADVN